MAKLQQACVLSPHHVPDALSRDDIRELREKADALFAQLSAEARHRIGDIVSDFRATLRKTGDRHLALGEKGFWHGQCTQEVRDDVTGETTLSAVSKILGEEEVALRIDYDVVRIKIALCQKKLKR
jgi:hypothetical protein